MRTVSDRDWVVTLDITADEYYGAEQVKRALVRYPMKVTRVDVDPAHQPLRPGALDCYEGTPQRISTPEPARAGAGGLSPQAPQRRNTPMKHPVLALLGLLAVAAAPAARRWRSCAGNACHWRCR